MRTCFFRPYTLAIFFTVLLFSCRQEDPDLDPQELQALTRYSAEKTHQILVSTQEVLDITSTVLSEEGISIEGEETQPQSCAPALKRQYIQDKTHYDTIIYSGTINLDYSSQTDCAPTGPVRRGHINDIFTYIISNKTSFSVEQYLQLDNFKRDNIELNGKFTLWSATGRADSLRSMGARMNDENVSVLLDVRLANKRLNQGNPEKDSHAVTGKLSGLAEDGKSFTADISQEVIYNYTCSGSLVPVQGTLEIKVKGKNVTMDYGNGECDRLYTVTLEGNTVTYSF